MMPCYSPLTAYRSHTLNDSGKRSLVFNPAVGARDRRVDIPCGQCIGCRLEYSRQWAMRCVHEASLYEHNSFITLTYNDAHLPSHASLRYRDLQLFFKRARKRLGKFRYFAAGEYGEESLRPHYHAIIFGIDFARAWHPGYFDADRHGNVVTAVSKSVDYVCYDSTALKLLWSDPDTKEGIGNVLVGSANFKTAAYVARYVTAKVTGDDAFNHYVVRDVDGDELIVDDEFVLRQPERALMSRRPGIGKAWFDKFKHDVYKDDTVIINGKAVKPPKYYDNQLDSDFVDDIKLDRKRGLARHKSNCTHERLRVREHVKHAQISSLKRTI